MKSFWLKNNFWNPDEKIGEKTRTSSNLDTFVLIIKDKFKNFFEKFFLLRELFRDYDTEISSSFHFYINKLTLLYNF